MAQDEEYMLTTEDNPYNPFTNFDEWYAFDTQKGYNTCGYLARVSFTSSELSEHDQGVARRQAIDEICDINVFGNFRKIYRNGTKIA